jgi:hypothetical protein
MPEINRFYGIAIETHSGDHHPPSSPAEYSGQEASVDIATRSVIAGDLPSRAYGLAAGGWRLAAGGWRLVAGGWRLAAGGWWLAAGGWRLAAGGWRLAAGGWCASGRRSIAQRSSRSGKRPASSD